MSDLEETRCIERAHHSMNMFSIMYKDIASFSDFEIEHCSGGILTSVTMMLLLLLLFFAFDCEQFNILSSCGI